MAILPNIWAQGGALFAFSGMDGPTDSESSLVGSTLPQGKGILFHTKIPVTLEFPHGNGVTYEYEIVANDLISTTLSAKGARMRLEVTFLDKDTVVGRIAALEVDEVSEVRIGVGIGCGEIAIEPQGIVIKTQSEGFALFGSGANLCVDKAGLISTLGPDQELRFALGYSSVDTRHACGKASLGLCTDIGSVVEDRISFFKNLPAVLSEDPTTQRTFCKCASVQKVNCCTAQGEIKFNWTTPDRWPHRNMWLWDSAFHALGLRHFAPEWAKDAIRAVLAKQKANGFVPHMMGVSAQSDSVVTQPPVLSWATWEVFSKVDDKEFLEYCYPKLKAMVLYDCENLDRDGSGLWEWESPGASGMDNSPRFDQPLGDAVDLCSFLVNEMSYLEKIATVLSITCDVQMWFEMKSTYSALVNERMWDEATGFYYDLTPDAQMLRLKTVAGFMPLFAGISNYEQAATVISHLTNPDEFWRALPVPSVSADEPSFSGDMWRGPVWVNYNYLIIQGLLQYGYLSYAKDLRDRTLREVERWYLNDGVIYEFYDSESRRSPSSLRRKGKTSKLVNGAWMDGAIRDYHWTAALYIDLLLNFSEGK